MLEIDYILKLIDALKEKNVASIKMEGLELHFSLPRKIETEDSSPPLANEDTLPPDLRTDAITDFDKILNWSGTPSPSELSEISGVGDQTFMPVDPP